MKHVRTINFTDIDSGDEAAIIVRADREHVALGATLKEDGDYTVVFTKTECQELIKALQDAIG